MCISSQCESYMQIVLTSAFSKHNVTSPLHHNVLVLKDSPELDWVVQFVFFGPFDLCCCHTVCRYFYSSILLRYNLLKCLKCV